MFPAAPSSARMSIKRAYALADSGSVIADRPDSFGVVNLAARFNSQGRGSARKLGRTISALLQSGWLRRSKPDYPRETDDFSTTS